MLFPNINYAAAKSNIEVSKNTRIIINGKITSYKYGPIILGNELLLPYDELLPKLGVTNDKKHIIWDSSKKSLTIYKDNLKISNSVCLLCIFG
jgi:hypothetical protein